MDNDYELLYLLKEEPEEIDTTQETEKHLEIILPRGASPVAQG